MVTAAYSVRRSDKTGIYWLSTLLMCEGMALWVHVTPVTEIPRIAPYQHLKRFTS